MALRKPNKTLNKNSLFSLSKEHEHSIRKSLQNSPGVEFKRKFCLSKSAEIYCSAFVDLWRIQCFKISYCLAKGVGDENRYSVWTTNKRGVRTQNCTNLHTVCRWVNIILNLTMCTNLVVSTNKNEFCLICEHCN